MLDESVIRQRFLDFEARFGRGGEIDLYFAPGRVNIIGDHTDYNGGLVLPIAIEQGTYLMIRGSELPPSRLYSVNRKEEARFHPSDIRRTGDWADYVRGVCLYAQESCGDLKPFDGLYFGDLSIGVGLSSSASIELVTAFGLASTGCEIKPMQAVRLGRRSENDFVGLSCGVMDQFTVAFAREGHALLVDCETMEYRQVPYGIKDAVLVVGHTGIYRSLTDTPYNRRRAESEKALDALSSKLHGIKSLGKVPMTEFDRVRWSIPDKLAMRAEHVIYESARVEEAARALERGDAPGLGHLMNRSHESLRDLFEASSKEQDRLQELSVAQPGVHGCRMTGGGFGGCVIALVSTDKVERYLRDVGEKYWQSTHYEPEFIVTRPAGGARKLRERT